MVQLRPGHERGHTQVGWLDSCHTFSFGHYQDAEHMGYHDLRVINEDRVIPGEGFGTHPHRDMEILTWVLEGALEHKDSLGNGSIIRPGEIQRMSAGTGILHSEFNPSDSDPVHFLQIWILPQQHGLKPGYEQLAFSDEELQGKLRLIASRDGREGAVTIHQDAEFFVARLDPEENVHHDLAPGRHAWVQVARGAARVNSVTLSPGDGAAISEEKSLDLSGVDSAEVLLFDLA